MTVNELADELIIWYPKVNLCVMSSNMLRQQAQEIADLKIANQDLKYQLIKKSGEQVLDDFSKDMLQKQAKEIEELKENLEDCTCQGGHSKAYLKIKER